MARSRSAVWIVLESGAVYSISTSSYPWWCLVFCKHGPMDDNSYCVEYKIFNDRNMCDLLSRVC
jgi:hypothetical protein